VSNAPEAGDPPHLGANCPEAGCSFRTKEQGFRR
jgi:hypothetical protein